MLECNDIDAQMMDWLYDELEDTSSAPFAEHIDSCSRCQSELDSLTRTRAALRELPDEDPAPSISQILLHEAAKRAPAKRARAASMAEDDEKPGVLAWLFGWMKPVLAHPAAAALATLVLVVGIAGSLYVRGKGRTTEPVADEAKRGTLSAGDAPQLMPGTDSNKIPADLGDSYQARLADEGYDVDDLSEGAAAPSARAVGEDEIRGEAERQATAKPDPEPAFAEEQMLGRESDNTRDRDDRRNIADQKPKAPVAGKSTKVGTPPETNAVSTADPLLDAEDYDDDGAEVVGSRDEWSNKDVADKSGSKGKKEDKKTKKKAPAKESPPPPPADAEPSGSGGATSGNTATHTVSTGDPKKELAWAKTQEQKMTKLIRARKCKDAAVVANDILDRNPSYYYKNIDKSADVKRCQWYFVEEQRRRAASRAKNRRSKAGDASDELADPMTTE